MQDIFDDIVSNCPIGARTPGWKGVMPSHMQDSEPEAGTEHHADESVPPDNDNDSNASDEMKNPNTSMETTNTPFSDEFFFDNHSSRCIPYSEIKQKTKNAQPVKDDLPPYVLRSNKPLFMGVFDDTTSSPCLEIGKEHMNKWMMFQ